MASGSKTGALTNSFGASIGWTTTPDAINNKSVVTVNLYLNYYNVDIGTRTATITIDGTTYNISVPAIKDYTSGLKNRLIATESVDIAHNPDGSRDAITVSGMFPYNLTMSDGTRVTTRSVSTSAAFDKIDRTTPSVSATVSNISQTALTLTGISNVICDRWYYSLNGGTTWIAYDTNAKTSAAKTITGLSPNTSYAIKIKARKLSNYKEGISGLVNAKTLGGSILNSVSAFNADDVSPAILLNWTIYNPAAIHKLSIKIENSILFEIQNLTGTSGNKNISLSPEQRTLLLVAMKNTKNITVTYVLTTYENGNQLGDASSATAQINTTAANSAPLSGEWTYLDSNSNTVAISEDNQIFIKNKSVLRVNISAATPRNEASINSYTVTVGATSMQKSTSGIVNFGTIPNYGNIAVTITIIDSRGYVATSVKYIPVVDYEPIKIEDYTARRINEVESTVQLYLKGKLSPININDVDKNVVQKAEYRAKNPDGNWSQYYNLNLSTSTSTDFERETTDLTADGEPFYFDSNNAYDIEIKTSDRLTEDILTTRIFKGKPLMALRAQMVGINTANPTSALDIEEGYSTQNGCGMLGFRGAIECDFNLITGGGIYYYGNNPVQQHTPQDSAGILEIVESAYFIFQRFSCIQSGCDLYMRYYNIQSKVWSEWNKKGGTEIITVSDLAEAPIIALGDTANYIKAYADSGIASEVQ